VFSCVFRVFGPINGYNWHSIGLTAGMKVIHLQQPKKELSLTQKFIKAMLNRDVDSFKETNRQFLRNNPLYFSNLGIIA